MLRAYKHRPLMVRETTQRGIGATLFGAFAAEGTTRKTTAIRTRLSAAHKTALDGTTWQ
jgi:hypothetical protein